MLTIWNQRWYNKNGDFSCIRNETDKVLGQVTGVSSIEKIAPAVVRKETERAQRVSSSVSFDAIMISIEIL